MSQGIYDDWPVEDTAPNAAAAGAEKIWEERATEAGMQALALSLGIEPSSVHASLLSMPLESIQEMSSREAVLAYNAATANARREAFGHQLRGRYDTLADAAASLLRQYYEHFRTGTSQTNADVDRMVGLLPWVNLNGRSRNDLADLVRGAVVEMYTRERVRDDTDQSVMATLGRLAGPRGPRP